MFYNETVLEIKKLQNTNPSSYCICSPISKESSHVSEGNIGNMRQNSGLCSG